MQIYNYKKIEAFTMKTRSSMLNKNSNSLYFDNSKSKVLYAKISLHLLDEDLLYVPALSL